MQKYEQTTRLYDFTAGQKVTTSGTSAQSAAVACNEVMLTATADMYVTAAANPTAAASAGSIFLAGGTVIHLQITPGWKVAAIQSTAAGALYILPVA